MNPCEKLRYSQVTGGWLVKSVISGQGRGKLVILRDRTNAILSLVLSTKAPEYKEAPTPGRVSVARKHGNPDGVRRLDESAGKPTAREAESPGGSKMAQEANAASRKARGIHNPADRAIPDPKGCRRGPGESPKGRYDGSER